MNITLAIEPLSKAVTQFTNFGFNSFGASPAFPLLGAKTDGIYLIGEDETDEGGARIDAEVVTHRTDFGIPNQKRIRALTIGYEADGDIQVDVAADEAANRVTRVLNTGKELASMGQSLNPGRDIAGRYFTVGIKNQGGADFSIDSVEVALTILPHKRTVLK